MITVDTIMEAYLFLRKNNMSIPDETLDFIKDSALEKLKEQEVKKLPIHDVSKRYVIEVFFNGRRIEHRSHKDEVAIKEALENLKETYKDGGCTFYFGSLNDC